MKNSLVKVKINNDMGYGVFALRPIFVNEILCEYRGKVLTRDEFDIEQAKYDKDAQKYGSFVLTITPNCHIDATHYELDKFGRMINHDMLDPNAVLEIVHGPNRVILRAVRDINPGEQVFYDYYNKLPIDDEAKLEHEWLVRSWKI